jgi:hypothetical protein
MAFDSTGFEPWPRQEPKPKGPSAKEKIFCFAGVAFALMMLVTPISAGALIDLVKYLAGK